MLASLACPVADQSEDFLFTPEEVARFRADVAALQDLERQRDEFPLHMGDLFTTDAYTNVRNVDAFVKALDDIIASIDDQTKVIPWHGDVAGKRDLLQQIRRHPLFRALRVDKLTIAAMEALGARRGRISAAIGPCIAQPSYEADEGFRTRFLEPDPANERFFADATWGKPHFDLWTANREQLEHAGLLPSSIFVAGLYWAGSPGTRDRFLNPQVEVTPVPSTNGHAQATDPGAPRVLAETR